MLPLPTAVDTSSPTFAANAAAMRQQLDRLREELRVAAEDRSARALARHKEQGKLTAAEMDDLVAYLWSLQRPRRAE